ncbi:MAG: KamA family radical SAM protein, partial [Victivallaceae bacterium]
MDAFLNHKNIIHRMKFYRKLNEVVSALNLTEKNPAAARQLLAMQPVLNQYPLLINSYLLSLINPELGSDDPIWQQFLPAQPELADESSEFDPLAEQKQMIAPRTIRRFRDRVVIVSTAKCAAYCRFCFRKRFWKHDAHLDDLSDGELDEIVATLNKHPEISEILLSGGDIMLLGEKRRLEIIQRLHEIKTIQLIRLATRVPVTAPELISDDFIEKLSKFEKIWLVTHFNHPAETTSLAMNCCKKFVRHGIPVLNQSVLLKGVNDTPEILEQLFRTLTANKIKPHYLFHVDPVRGVRHFATGIECGLDILRNFRSRLSSIAVPTFAIDLPEGGGKVALQPEYRREGKFP